MASTNMSFCLYRGDFRSPVQLDFQIVELVGHSQPFQHLLGLGEIFGQRNMICRIGLESAGIADLVNNAGRPDTQRLSQACADFVIAENRRGGSTAGHVAKQVLGLAKQTVCGRRRRGQQCDCQNDCDAHGKLLSCDVPGIVAEPLSKKKPKDHGGRHGLDLGSGILFTEPATGSLFG